MKFDIPSLLTLVASYNPLQTYFTNPLSSVCSTSDWESVHSVVTQYPHHVDSKTLSHLSAVFTPNATIDLGAFLPATTGLPGIQAGLAAVTAGFHTQHMIGAPWIQVGEDRRTANATTMLQTTVSLNPLEVPGQVAWVYGVYTDLLVKTKEGWRIESKVFRMMGPGFAGNASIFGM